MRLELFYPVRPFHTNQSFGANPSYYSRFLDQFGRPEKGHMGVDLMAVHGQPVYASIEGDAWYEKDSHGGEGVYIQTNQPLDYANGNCWFKVVHWHLIGDTDSKYPPPISMSSHTSVKVGDLIGYADNTGAPFESSGDHLHLGLMPINQLGNPTLAANGYGGCIDPVPYFNNYYATDHDFVITTLNKELSTAEKVVVLLKQLLGYH